MNQQYQPQRSAEWFYSRLGMFTNSKLSVLMPSKGAKRGGDTTYIEERLWELKDGQSKEVNAWTLQYGTDHEPIAKQLLADTLNVELVDCEFIKHPVYYWYGGSPELEPILYKGELYSTEIKCAATGRSHAENIAICESEDVIATLKDIYPELYWQTQGHMFLQNTQKCIFVAYHPSKIAPETSFKWCVIPRNDADIEVIKERLNHYWEYYKTYANKYGVNVEHLLKPENSEELRKLLTDPIVLEKQQELAELEKQWAIEKNGSVQGEIFTQ